METLLVAAVVLVAVAIVIVAVRQGLRTRPAPSPQPWPADEGASGRTIVLDIGAADPDSPAVQRLVHEVAWQALQAEPALHRVEVRSRDGVRLGLVLRPEPRQIAELPDELYEPHQARATGPAVIRDASPGLPQRHPDEEVELDRPPRRRPFAAQFDLPETVQERVTDPHSPLAVVRAILSAAGHEVTVEKDLLRVGDLGITIADVSGDATVALNHAFLRIQQARVTRGIIVRLGWVRGDEIRHREAAAPWVRHVGMGAVQRMADAVAVGADPVAFATGPQLVR